MVGMLFEARVRSTYEAAKLVALLRRGTDYHGHREDV